MKGMGCPTQHRQLFIGQGVHVVLRNRDLKKKEKNFKKKKQRLGWEKFSFFLNNKQKLKGQHRVIHECPDSLGCETPCHLNILKEKNLS